MIVGDIGSLIKNHYGGRIGILSFKTIYASEHSFTLSPVGSLPEAARNIFGMLRSLDEAPVDLILAEYVPEEGLGRAINDRLKRASQL